MTVPVWRAVLEAWRDLRARGALAVLAIALLYLVFTLNLLLHEYHGGKYVPAGVAAALVYAAALVLAVSAADRCVDRGAPRLLAYGTAAVLAAIAGSVVSWYLVLALGWRNWFDPAEPIATQRTQMLFESMYRMILGGLGTAAYAHWRETRNTARLLQLSELHRAQHARRLQETRLLALQARVDPEFLFGALRQVSLLHAHDPAAAGVLLNEVIVLLRGLMPSDDAPASTVVHEFGLAVSYLRVACNAVTALTVEMAISPEAAGARLAPMLVLPLLKAALAARGESMPRLQLRADTAGDRLQITLSAPAPDASPRADSAELDALRERLAQLHGANATLLVEPGPGLVASVDLPLEHEESR